METQAIRRYEIRRSPDTVREIITILFRHKRVVVFSCLAILGGAALTLFLLGVKYEAQTKILVRHQRADVLVSSDNTSHVAGFNDQNLSDREINSEVALLQSQDLLQQVVKRTGLDVGPKYFWSDWIPSFRTQEERTARAVRKLKGQLNITPIPNSNIIEVKYSSRDPERASRVLSELGNLYVAKHVEVNRPAGVFDFFHNQAQQAAQRLQEREAGLKEFISAQNAVAPTVSRDFLLQKAVDFEGKWRETHADISETSKRIQALERQMTQVPARYKTVETTSDNQQLMANLKSTLATLEVKRAELLTKYDPGYRLVQELDQQIAEAQTKITAEEKKPLRQETTDSNPTFLVVEQELTRARAELQSLRAKAAATAPMASALGRQALLLDQKNIQLQNMVRETKVAEDNYLLYNKKQEEARITDALDSKRIMNISVAENPTAPVLPTSSPIQLLMAAIMLAMMGSVGTAFVAEYLDPSFRAPDEVVRCLNVPVLAVLPSKSHDLRFPQLPRNGNGNGNRLSSHTSSGESSSALDRWMGQVDH